MRSSWRVSFWAYAPVLFWIGVIFLLSSPEGSFEQTSRIIGPLLHFFFPNISAESEAVIHAFVRKTAHFTEYAILAFFAARACALSTPQFLRTWRYLLPLVVVAAVASLDEFNQSFEPSRTSSVWDAVLDLTGGTGMMVFLWLIKRPKALEPPT